MRSNVTFGLAHVPASVAAGILGISRQRVYQLAHSGRLRAVWIEGRVLIDLASIRLRKESAEK